MIGRLHWQGNDLGFSFFLEMTGRQKNGSVKSFGGDVAPHGGRAAPLAAGARLIAAPTRRRRHLTQRGASRRRRQNRRELAARPRQQKHRPSASPSRLVLSQAHTRATCARVAAFAPRRTIRRLREQTLTDLGSGLMAIEGGSSLFFSFFPCCHGFRSRAHRHYFLSLAFDVMKQTQGGHGTSLSGPQTSRTPAAPARAPPRPGERGVTVWDGDSPSMLSPGSTNAGNKREWSGSQDHWFLWWPRLGPGGE